MQFFDRRYCQLMLIGQSGTSSSYLQVIWTGRASISRILWLHLTQTWRSLVQGDGLAQWHFNQPSQSFLTNECVSVWPKRACVIFPSFYHKDAGRHSRGIRSTLCGDRQTGSANKMECLCISHLSVNIQIPLPTGTVCVCVCGTQSTALAWYPISPVSMTISMGPPDPLVLITIIIHPLTIARLLHNRPLVAASPMGSLTRCVKGSLFYGGGRLVDIN